MISHQCNGISWDWYESLWCACNSYCPNMESYVLGACMPFWEQSLLITE